MYFLSIFSFLSSLPIDKRPQTYPAFLHLVDIAGLIKGASEGAGLGNAFLSHIQAVDGIFHLVRAFESEEVIHLDYALAHIMVRFYNYLNGRLSMLKIPLIPCVTLRR